MVWRSMQEKIQQLSTRTYQDELENVKFNKLLLLKGQFLHMTCL